MSESRVYAVASGKGGVGKTTTAVAFGVCAAAAGRSTVVVDADLGMGNLGTLVGLADAEPTVHDVLAGDADVHDAVHEAPGGFDAMPGGAALSEYADADPANLRGVVEELRARYDVVIVDTGAGLSHDTVLPLGLADEVVLVTTPAAIAVANTETTREVAERLGATVSGAVVTDVTDERDADVDLDVPILGTIPRDEVVDRAASAGVPVPVFAPESPAARAYAELVAGLLEVPVTSLDLPDDATESENSDATFAAEDIPDADEVAAREAEATEDEVAEEAVVAEAAATAESEEREAETSRSLFGRLRAGLFGGNGNN